MEQRCKHCGKLEHRHHFYDSTGPGWCGDGDAAESGIFEPEEQLEPEPEGEGLAFWAAFLDGFTMAGLFGKARIPGDATRIFAQDTEKPQEPTP